MQNTSQVPKGQAWVDQQKAIVEVLTNDWNVYLAGLLGRLGYPPGSQLNLDLRTGRVERVYAQATEQLESSIIK